MTASFSSRHAEDLPQALDNYERVLRPFVDEIQTVNPTLLKLGMPMTQWGIDAFHAVAALAWFLKIPDSSLGSPEDRDGGWQLLEYG